MESTGGLCKEQEEEREEIQKEKGEKEEGQEGEKDSRRWLWQLRGKFQDFDKTKSLLYRDGVFFIFFIFLIQLWASSSIVIVYYFIY